MRDGRQLVFQRIQRQGLWRQSGIPYRKDYLDPALRFEHLFNEVFRLRHRVIATQCQAIRDYSNGGISCNAIRKIPNNLQSPQLRAIRLR